MKWSKIETVGNAPPSRLNHSAIVFKDSMFVFGGTNGANTLGDFWEYKFSKITCYFFNVYQRARIGLKSMPLQVQAQERDTQQLLYKIQCISLEDI
jgi:hypothetical protein